MGGGNLLRSYGTTFLTYCLPRQHMKLFGLVCNLLSDHGPPRPEKLLGPQLDILYSQNYLVRLCLNIVCFQVMDRVNNQEEDYVSDFMKATTGFGECALKLFSVDRTDETRWEC